MKNFTLFHLYENEIKRSMQAKLKAGIDTNPGDEKCACLCAPKTDKGYQEVLKKE